MQKEKEITLGVIFLRFPKDLPRKPTRSRILKMLRSVETADIKFLEALTSSVIVFAKKRGIPRETVVDMVELAFGKKLRNVSIVVASYPLLMQLCGRLNEIYSQISEEKIKEN